MNINPQNDHHDESITVDAHDAKETHQAVVANESDDAIEVKPEN